MAYRLRLEVHDVEAAIRALDLLHRLDVAMLELETARQDNGFLVHLSYEAPGEAAARHIAVRIGQIVGVKAAEMVPSKAFDLEARDLGARDLGARDLDASPAGLPLPTLC